MKVQKLKEGPLYGFIDGKQVVPGLYIGDFEFEELGKTSIYVVTTEYGNRFEAYYAHDEPPAIDWNKTYRKEESYAYKHPEELLTDKSKEGIDKYWKWCEAVSKFQDKYEDKYEEFIKEHATEEKRGFNLNDLLKERE